MVAEKILILPINNYEILLIVSRILFQRGTPLVMEVIP